jgi:hypothetical protein
MIKFPQQLTYNPLQKEFLIEKWVTDLTRLHTDFIASVQKLSDMSKMISDHKNDITSHHSSMKSHKGEMDRHMKEMVAFANQMKDLYIKLQSELSRVQQYRDGKDAEITDVHLETLAEKLAKRVKVKDGKDAVLTKKHIDGMVTTITEKIKVDVSDPLKIIDQIMKLPEGKRLSTKHIDGLEQTISAFQSQLKRQYLHGAGDTVIAGAGITITKNTNGAVISTSASGGVLTATGTIDDSNTVFVFTSAPTELVINGASYIKTGGAITWTGTTTVTLSSPVGVNGSIYGRV